MKMNFFEFLIINTPIRRFIQNQIEIKGFLDVPNFVKDGTVLEIGCGNGYGTKLINKYFHPKEICGIDIDEKMIDLAKKNGNTKTSFVLGDVAQLPFEDNSFDGIFDFAILHHVPNWKKAIDEMYRVLKKGGQVFIEDASIETFSTPFGRLIKLVSDHPYESMYSMNELFDYVSEKGFTLQKKKIYKLLNLTNRFVFIGIKK